METQIVESTNWPDQWKKKGKCDWKLLLLFEMHGDIADIVLKLAYTTGPFIWNTVFYIALLAWNTFHKICHSKNSHSHLDGTN